MISEPCLFSDSSINTVSYICWRSHTFYSLSCLLYVKRKVYFLVFLAPVTCCEWKDLERILWTLWSHIRKYRTWCLSICNYNLITWSTLLCIRYLVPEHKFLKNTQMIAWDVDHTSFTIGFIGFQMFSIVVGSGRERFTFNAFGKCISVCKFNLCVWNFIIVCSLRLE